MMRTSGRTGSSSTGWKLFRLRKDGTLGSLFISRGAVIPSGKWLKAAFHPTKGFKARVGWHACAAPYAPHLSEKGRVWAFVELRGCKKDIRPISQGGLWYVAKWMKVKKVIDRFDEPDE